MGRKRKGKKEESNLASKLLKNAKVKFGTTRRCRWEKLALSSSPKAELIQNSWNDLPGELGPKTREK